jgi:CheY-like chemotaxis protein
VALGAERCSGITVAHNRRPALFSLENRFVIPESNLITVTRREAQEQNDMSIESKPQIVLSVDDNDVDGALLERAFKRMAIPAYLYRVSEGPQALAYLGGEGIYQDRAHYPLPDLVLLDLAMPKMSGLDVLKWIREQPEVNRTRVLIFTASERPEDEESAKQIGVDGYLLKPTKFEDLKLLVKEIHEVWLTAKGKKAKAPARRSKLPENAARSAENISSSDLPSTAEPGQDSLAARA